MKKLISVITALSVILGAGVCFADYSDVSSDDTCYKAVSRLRDFNIMSGYEDGTFKPDSDVTRAETARLLCSVMNQEGYDAVPDFIDVPETHWAAKYISYMKELGTISGYEDGTFRPESNITYNEFLKMVLSIVGYDPFAEARGGYPEGYIKCAEQQGITADLTFKGDDIVKRCEAAIMINNALDVPLVVVDGYETQWNGIITPVFVTKDQSGSQYQTPLTYFHNIYTVEGTIGRDDSLPVETQREDKNAASDGGGTSVSGTSGTAAADGDSEKILDAYVLMDKLKIMPFEENINLSKTVTRGDFAKYASRLTKYAAFTKKTSYASAKAAFEDIPKDSKIYSAVDIMTQSGYMEGIDENSKALFKPYETMTEEECIKSLMKMLRYDTSEDYMEKAEETGLTKYRKAYNHSTFDLGVLTMYLAGAADAAGLADTE